jgi:hypothetical protein
MSSSLVFSKSPCVWFLLLLDLLLDLLIAERLPSCC